MNTTDYSLHKREGYSDPSPYPEVKVQAPNRYYSEVLMDDYAGVVSEFTAIEQYLFHYFVLKDQDKEVGKMIENISISEMLHMEILAETIILLGGKPVFRGSYSTRGNFWNGKMVYYGANLCEQLKADLNAEHKAIQNYKHHITIIQDPYIQAILKRIILDEEVHVKLFEEAISRHCV